MSVRAIVTDIEGTTSSLSFVQEVLFPYARREIAGFVRRHARDATVAAQLKLVDDELGGASSPAQQIAALERWIDEDRKFGPLKTLQGLLWERGYREGDFLGHVYPDAVAELRRWHAAGHKLYVYSSGSVRAQELLFQFSEHGDLRSLFSGHFDTAIGGKREVESYQRILSAIGFSPAQTLFLSDVAEELRAAQAAGMQVCLIVRGATSDSTQYPSAHNFEEVARQFAL